MKPRQRIRPISPRQAEKNKVYTAAKRKWWKRISAAPAEIGKLPCCSLPGCFRDAEKNPHHIIPRSVRKDLEAVEENFLAVCWRCHVDIHADPTWARANGYLGFSTDDLTDLAERRLTTT